MSQIIIGIDNGLSGAFVALSNHPGPPIAMATMPTRGKAKGNEIDCDLALMFFDKWDRHQITAILETPGKFSPGVQALCSSWDSYGAIRSILETRGIRHHRITPQAWQKVMLPGCAKGDTKPAALARAKQLWPGESWLASPGCSKPHDGMIDAALIAEYGRIKNL